jgi:urea transport system permease protein
MGGLFIGVVMFFPNGLAGLWHDYGHHITNKFAFISNLFKRKVSVTSDAPVTQKN